MKAVDGQCLAGPVLFCHVDVTELYPCDCFCCLYYGYYTKPPFDKSPDWSFCAPTNARYVSFFPDCSSIEHRTHARARAQRKATLTSVP